MTKRSRKSSWSLLAFACAVSLVLFAQTGGRAAPGESLPFFTSFSVTGGYRVAGVDLKPGAAQGGFVTGTIEFKDTSVVPANADILAAYLYWETITNGDPIAGSVGAQFRGQDITIEHAASMSSDQLGQSFAPCWTSGGGGSANYILTTYRADVLQLLPLQFDENGISTGRRLVNDADLSTANKLTVRLPEAGNGNQTPQSAGASLFVVYRDPNPNAALTRVVAYDGLFVKTQGLAMQHTIRGFFDAANSSPVINMTHIVGSGSDNNNDRVFFNGAVVTPNGQTSPLDAFKRTGGGTSDRGWSNPTFANLSFPATAAPPTAPSQASQNDSQYGEWVTTRVDHGGQDSPNDCLTWAAIIFSTTAQDADGDGLLDKEETADNVENGVRYSLKDPKGENGVMLPPFKRMGALPTKRDMFVEIAAMKANANTQYGDPVDAPLDTTAIECGQFDFNGNMILGETVQHSPVVVDCVGHNHMPSPISVGMLGQAYAAAPVDARFPSAGTGIALHADVGDPTAYRALFPALTQAERNAANAYLIGNGTGDNAVEFARGGESVLEGPCTGPCTFFAFPGTVTWKSGYGLYKKELLDDNRERYFRFGFYAHAKGAHKSPFPCLDAADVPTHLVSGQCPVKPNPEFYVPSGVSGSADFPGGDFLVTLGFFDNTTFIATDFAVAATTMHEMGHTIGLGHGGDPLPNCKPNYGSVMNYTYQLSGRVDVNGVSHLVYSDGANTDLNETSLRDDYAAAGSYRLSWFAPKPPNDTRKTLKRFCSGQSFDPANPPGDWIRVDGGFDASGNPTVDWNADGAFGFGTDGSGAIQSGSQDVNFDGGTLQTQLTDHNDWAALRLNQVGASRNIFGLSLESESRWDGTHVSATGTVGYGNGVVVGHADGTIVGLGDGIPVGFADGTQVGLADGTLMGLADGTVLGIADGTVVGFSDGIVVGLSDGTLVGFADGTLVGFADGTPLGLSDGTVLGMADGTPIGFADGILVGLADGVGILTDKAAQTATINEQSNRHAAESGNLPGPRQPTVCVIGVGSCVNPGAAPGVVTLHRHRLDFLAPTWTSAPISGYSAYRTGPDQKDKLVGTTPNASQLWIVDPEELPHSQSFIYYIVANLADSNVSGRSVDVTQIARNDTPVAGTDVIANTYASKPNATLTIAAPGVLANDKADADSYPTSLKAVPLTNATTAKGGKVTLNADGSFTYTPGPKSGSSDTFTYRANNGPWSGKSGIQLNDVNNSGPVTVTILLTGPTK